MCNKVEGSLFVTIGERAYFENKLSDDRLVVRCGDLIQSPHQRPT